MVSTSCLDSTIRSVHFIGIGGAGMQSLAEVLHAQGYLVTGSDLQCNSVINRLKSKGICISLDQRSPVLKIIPDLVVHSSAVSQENAELKALKHLNVPVISRGQLLAILAQNKCSIAVAGTHGKTSTVGLISHIMLQHALDPIVIGGGYYYNLQGNVHIGESKYLVTEGDESDASLLLLKPNIAVLTSVSEDHMATYDYQFGQLLNTFQRFLNSKPENNQWMHPEKGLILCQDDPEIKKMIPTLQFPMITYGIKENAMITGVDIQQVGDQLQFIALRNALHLPPLSLRVKLSGRYSVLNSLAAVSVGHLLKIPDVIIQKAFETYQGVQRRFQVLNTLCIQGQEVPVVDDYGHHPREIVATFQAVRSTWPNRRVLHVFQPHRYTRTRDLFEPLVEVLSKEPDELILLPIYSAHEKPIEGIDSIVLSKAVSKRTEKIVWPVKKEDAVNSIIRKALRPNDVLLFQGAGNVSQMAHDFVQQGVA